MTPDEAVKPKRIQRSRAKGWRMPDGAIYVGRPSKWGNPWVAGEPWCPTSAAECAGIFRGILLGNPHPDSRMGRVLAEISELAGHDLACWCPLDQPCHADVLLELANPDQPQ